MSRKAKSRVSLKVSVDMPPGSNIAMLREFIRCAIISAPGGLRPDDPMHDLDRDSVTVSLLQKVTTYA